MKGQASTGSLLRGYDDLVSPVDQKQVLVIELGTLSTRIGYSGEDEPELVMPACMTVARSSNRNDFAQNRLKRFFGAEALSAVEEKEDCELAYPFAGEGVDAEKLEEFFKFVFEEEFNTDPMRLDLFVVEPFAAAGKRARLCELFFETFRVQSLNFVPSALCSLLYGGLTTGLSVEAGEAFTSVVPVFEGFVLRHRVKHLPFAGSHATEVIAAGLRDAPLKSRNAAALFRAVKEKLAVAAQDYEREAGAAEVLAAEERFYELPDGQLVELGRKTAFDAGEVLFCPGKVLGSTATVLCEEALDAVMCGDSDTQRRLCDNVVLSGGASLTRGYFERFKKDLETLSAAKSLPHRVGVGRAPDVPHSAWVGGSILASIATVQGLKIRKAQYEESDNKEAFFAQKVL